MWCKATPTVRLAYKTNLSHVSSACGNRLWYFGGLYWKKAQEEAFKFSEITQLFQEHSAIRICGQTLKGEILLISHVYIYTTQDTLTHTSCSCTSEQSLQPTRQHHYSCTECRSHCGLLCRWCIMTPESVWAKQQPSSICRAHEIFIHTCFFGLKISLTVQI